jgi:acetolactate synthase-1/2/3 large subunit
LLLAKDYQSAEIGEPSPRAPTQRPRRSPTAAEIERARKLLEPRPLLAIVGDEVARDGARAELSALVNHLDAKVAATPEGRDAFDNRSPRFLGISGTLGHAAVAAAAREAAAFLIVGTRLPMMARQGLETMLQARPILSIGRQAPFVRSSAESVHLEGDLRSVLAQLTGPTREEAAPVWARPDGAPAPAGLLTAAASMEVLGRMIPARSVIVVDAGNTGALATHYIPAPVGGRWLIAMGMAGMGYSFGAAVGAAFATGERVTVVAGDGAFYMNGLDVHTAAEHNLPITYVIFDNHAHGMCLVRERLLLSEHAGYNEFAPAHLGAGLRAMFPRIVASDVRTPKELEQALARAYAMGGPAVIAVALDEVEIPPHAAFVTALAKGARTIERKP